MNKIYLPISLFIITLVATTTGYANNSVTSIKDFTPQSAVFRENKGQWDERAQYRMTRFDQHDASVAFTNKGLVYNITRYKENASDDNEETQTLVWKLNFDNANKDVTIGAVGQNSSRSNYFIGRDKSKHASNVKDYSQLTYNEIYPGIDLQYYLHELNLKYDFIVKPNAKADNITLSAEGVEGISINRAGELEVQTVWGTLIEQTPYSYQVINGKIQEIDVRFDLKGAYSFGFKVYGDYDRTKELIIDPVVLNWSTFARAMKHSYAHNIALDEKGYVYITGKTEDELYMSPGVYDDKHGGGIDGYVMKFEPDGSNNIFATYVGGKGYDWGTGIDVTPDGSVFVTGWTTSDDLPTTPGAMHPNIVSSFGQDGYIFKLKPDGSALEYATYFGGSKNDYVGDGYSGNTGNNRRNYIGTPLKVNDKGEAFITGWTLSDDFGFTHGSHPGGFGNYAFVVKLNASGSGYIYSKLIGNAKAKAIAINDKDEVFITGDTYDPAFPTTPGVISNTVDATNGDIFVTKISADANTLLYSTFLPGNDKDHAYSIDINSKGEAFVGGDTRSSDIGTVNTISAFGGGGSDGLVARISPDGKTLVWAAYIGEGQGSNSPNSVMGLDVTEKGEVFMAIQAGGVVGALPQLCLSKSFGGGGWDHYIAKLSNTGVLEFATYMGGSHADYGSPKIAVKEKCGCGNEIFISGDSHSPNFPSTPGTFEPNKPNGAYDQPVVYSYKPEYDIDFSFTTAECSKPVNFTSSYNGSCVWKPGAWQPTDFWWDFGDGTTSTAKNPSHTYSSPGDYEIKMVIGCPCDTVVKSLNVPGNPNLKVALGPDKNFCAGDPINEKLTAGNDPSATYTWHDNSVGQTYTATKPGKYWAMMSDGQCTAVDTVEIKVTQLGGTREKEDVKCFGDSDGWIKALPKNGTEPYSYLWGNGQTTQTATGLAAGEHKISITDANGCKLEASLSIEQPPAIQLSATKTDGNCSGQGGSATVTASGGTPGFTYSWSPSGGNSATANNLSAGTYTVTVTDGNGCQETKTVNIQSNGQLQVNSSAVKAQCGGKGSATITATGGDGNYTYQWDAAAGNQTTATATGLDPGTYSYTVTDQSGCSSNGQVLVEGEGNITATASISYGDGCDRFGGVNGIAEAVPSGGTPPYSYQWDDPKNQTTAKATGLPKGTYHVTIVDANGCATKSEAVIEERIQLSINVDAQTSCASCTDGQATVNIGGFGTPPYTVRWNDENEQTTTTATGLKPGTYVVTVYDDKDCSNTDTITLGVTGMEDPEVLEDMISIYPNPNNGSFYINIKPGQQQLSLKIYDVTGKLVHTDHLSTGLHPVHPENTGKGIYLVELSNEEFRVTKRVHIMK